MLCVREDWDCLRKLIMHISRNSLRIYILLQWCNFIITTKSLPDLPFPQVKMTSPSYILPIFLN